MRSAGRKERQLFEQMFRDDHPLYLIGPLVDLGVLAESSN